MMLSVQHTSQIAFAVGLLVPTLGITLELLEAGEPAYAVCFLDGFMALASQNPWAILSVWLRGA